jgi:hypothetical protein
MIPYDTQVLHNMVQVNHSQCAVIPANDSYKMIIEFQGLTMKQVAQLEAIINKFASEAE